LTLLLPSPTTSYYLLLPAYYILLSFFSLETHSWMTFFYLLEMEME